MTAENPHAGQGAVVLDIGDGVGALVVTMPAAMTGLEVEIVPTGTRPSHRHSHSHSHDAGPHDHQPHHHDHSDGSAGGLHGSAGAPPHVAVVARPTPSGLVHSLVFPELGVGTYDLYVRPDGPTALTASVADGTVTESAWPS